MSIKWATLMLLTNPHPSKFNPEIDIINVCGMIPLRVTMEKSCRTIGIPNLDIKMPKTRPKNLYKTWFIPPKINRWILPINSIWKCIKWSRNFLLIKIQMMSTVSLTGLPPSPPQLRCLQISSLKFKNVPLWDSTEVKALEVSSMETPNVPYLTVESFNLQKFMLTLHPKAASSKSPKSLRLYSPNHNKRKYPRNRASNRYWHKDQSKLWSQTHKHHPQPIRILLSFKVSISSKNTASQLTIKSQLKNKSFKKHKMHVAKFQDKCLFQENKHKSLLQGQGKKTKKLSAN